ncbi:uncharacterized protein DDB_G0281497-like isoform X2 [Panonychus citri]|nr:uncharacterized protein DDB_G0281497-like isoform X2 [Panonychus citri]XP_053214245.1 uncharacterized protein DDB_G0281497-like isoform X2 [Panonychus citri]
MGNNNGVNGTLNHNYDTRGSEGKLDTGPKMMREEIRSSENIVTGGSSGSYIDPLTKSNLPLHPEVHLTESLSTSSTPSPSTTPSSTLSPWEISFKKLLIPSKNQQSNSNNNGDDDDQLSHHHQHLHHFHPNHQYPSANSRLSSLSSSSPPTSSTPSSSTRKQSRLIHHLSPPLTVNQGQNNGQQLTPIKDNDSFNQLSSPTSSSGYTDGVNPDGQSRYNQRPPKSAFQFDYDQANKKKLIPQSSLKIYSYLYYY